MPFVARIAGCLWFVCFATGVGLAEEKIKFSNSIGKSIEVRIFSESEQAWLKPALKIESGKSVESSLKFRGDHNIKLILEGKEFLLGTFDIQAAIRDQGVDEIEFLFVQPEKGAQPKAKIKLEKYQDGDIIETAEGRMRVRVATRKMTVNRTRMETRTRTITIQTSNGPQQAEQTYTVAVPYTEAVEQEVRTLESVDAHQVKSANKSGRLGMVFRAKGKQVQIKDSLEKKK